MLFMMVENYLFMILRFEYFLHNEHKEKDVLQTSARIAKVSNRLGLKILAPTPILQRLPIALAQVKTDNTS